MRAKNSKKRARNGPGNDLDDGTLASCGIKRLGE